MKERSLFRRVVGLLAGLCRGQPSSAEQAPPPAVAAWEQRLLGLQQAIAATAEGTTGQLGELQRAVASLAKRLEQTDLRVQTAHEASRLALEEVRGDLATASQELRGHFVALQGGLSALDRQLGRAGREQLRANTLVEAQQQQTQALIEQLRQIEAYHEADLAALRERLRADQSEARLQIIKRLFPVLDGLDEALAAGRKLWARALGAPSPRLTLAQRLAMALGRRPSPAPPVTEAVPLHAALESWMQGLTFIQERLLEVLSSEGVQPIAAQGQPFDPHLHMAVEVVLPSDSVLPGTIVSELRPGYIRGQHVLRYAEVVVAGETGSENEQDRRN